MSFFDINKIFREYSGFSSSQFEGILDSFVQTTGEQEFCNIAAQNLVKLVVPESALPSNLDRFAPLIHDGVAEFLSRISYKRLKKVILSQLELPEKSEAGKRLLHLAIHFPTLQKLAQVVARNSRVDSNIKRWLMSLEVESNPIDLNGQVVSVEAWLTRTYPESDIHVSPGILASASVADVIRFTKNDEKGRECYRGVFKILKPEVEKTLEEELLILEEVFTQLESNREKYRLENLQMSSLFQVVRDDLAREVDLRAEQSNLREAYELYDKNDRIRVPQLYHWKSSHITSMEYIEGEKITETNLNNAQQRKLAQLSFEAIICKPLFSQYENVLFHGDPHAGNILAITSEKMEHQEIALLDWTLASHLSKEMRFEFIQMLQGILLDDSQKISRSMKQLACESNDQELLSSLPHNLSKYMEFADYQDSDPMKRAFWLQEKVTMDGLVFPAEIILFRKAFFTLEGVLEDISPGFDMGDATEDYVSRLILEEIPQRCLASVFPLTDNAENYRTMLSNHDMVLLSFNQTMSIWNQTVLRSAKLIESQVILANEFLGYVTGFNLYR